MMRLESTVVCVKEDVEKSYMDKMLKDLKNMVWSSGCAPWYADHRGIITALSPYSLISFWRQTRKLDANDFNFY